MITEETDEHIVVAPHIGIVGSGKKIDQTSCDMVIPRVAITSIEKIKMPGKSE